MSIKILKKVNSFKPELLALSCTEDMFHLGLSLLKVVDKKILTIAGGVFPTFAKNSLKL